MAVAATWLIILGACLLLAGLTLRIALMMRSSDATPVGLRVPYGRELVRQYGSFFPGSRLPFFMRGTLIFGLILLAAGIACEILR